MNFNIIVCTDSEGGISKDGIIPWKIQEDYNYFKDTITNKLNNKPNIIILISIRYVFDLKASPPTRIKPSINSLLLYSLKVFKTLSLYLTNSFGSFLVTDN